MSDVDALVKDVMRRFETLNRASASPQDYINQVGLVFQLHDGDPRPCRAYFEIKPDPGATRDQTTGKFQRRIISAAIAVRPSLRSAGRPVTYAEARRILSATPVGRRAIATLTNPQHWKLVSVEHAGLRWTL